MTYERQPGALLLPPRSSPALDADLFPSYQAARNPEDTYRRLSINDDGRTAAALELLKDGKNVDLTVAFTPESEAVIASEIAKFDNWRSAVLDTSDVHPAAHALYASRVAEHRLNLEMIDASMKGDMAAFRDINLAVYGQPDEAVARGAFDWIGTDAERMLDAATPTQTATKAAARKVLSLTNGLRGDRKALMPSDEVFQTVRHDHNRPDGFYSVLFDGITLPDGDVTETTGNAVIDGILRNTQSGFMRFNDEKAGDFSVNKANRTFISPATYKLGRLSFYGTISHEASHVLEVENGLRGPLELSAWGLAGYEKGNEGRALVREQVCYPDFETFAQDPWWSQILLRSSGIAMSTGYGSEDPRPIRDTYAFINAVNTMYAAPESTDLNEATAKAHSKSGPFTMRLHRGSDGTGGSYRKDQVYLAGNIDTWNNAAQNGPSAVTNGDLFKGNSNDTATIRALQALGVLV